LFGSVTTTEIADALNTATGIDINRRRISQIPLRELGTHDVPIRLGSETSPVLKVTIVREEEFARFMADREKAAAGEAGETVAGEVAEVTAEASADVEEAAEADVEAIANVSLEAGVKTESVEAEIEDAATDSEAAEE
jgi:large subunit ribosomal protein L9